MIIQIKCEKCTQRIDIHDAERKIEMINSLECTNCGCHIENERFAFLKVKK